MPEWFEAIATHRRTHPDELGAIWLVKKFGEKKYPGISTAEVIYWDAGPRTPDGRTPEEYEQEGVLPIGVGGGRLDEHPFLNRPRKEGECAFTLVAKDLGVQDDPAIQQLSEYLVNNDLRGTRQPLDFANFVNVLHRKHPNDPEVVMRWAMLALDALYDDQEAFWNSTPQEFRKNAQIEGISGPNGKTLKMVTVLSDNEQMAGFAHFVRGGRAAIVIQQKSSGNVQIFINKSAGLELQFAEIARLVRYAEQNVRENILTTDPQILSAEGIVPGAEVWHCFTQGQMLLNGSLTAPNVPPTHLSLKVIQDLVRIGVNPRRFEKNRAPNCTKGICTSTMANPCPWYKFQLERCLAIRRR